MIELNEQEQRLKSLLLDVVKWIESSNTDIPQDGQTLPPVELQRQALVLRFAGGWVRDKLLGADSHDIDVAINKMTGYQFGLKVKEYLENPDNAAKYGPEGSEIAGGLHKIAANPEKSKQLETTNTKIFGLELDMVNLRKETYTDDSRNPKMEFGTPEEDAMRRDACVNALFYNLNTSEVEDFTKLGLSDMKNKLIRTPLEPYQTFKDDPLRVLRVIRFATRLNYTIDPAAQQSMGDQDIKDALRVKISRERVGIELEKMLRGRAPRDSLRCIDQLGLYTTVFTDPIAEPKYEPELQNWQATYEYMLEVIARNQSSADTLSKHLLQTKDDEYQAWISTAMVPWVDAPLPPPPKKNRQPVPFVISVAQEGFKAPNKVSNVLAASMQHLDDIRQLKDKYNSHSKFPNRRSEGDDATAPDMIGMSIRKWGTHWRQQVLFALLYEVFSDPEALQSIEKSYEKFIGHIASLNLLDVCEMKPLLDGKELSKALSTRPGPWMKDALDVVVAWQLRNPGDKSPEGAIDAVKIHLDATSRDGKGAQNAALSQPQLDFRNTLISHFLREVRAVFAHTPTNPSVTPAGRQRNNPQNQQQESFSEEAAHRPWKQDPYVLPLFQWVLHALTPSSVESHWPLLVPPILAMIDDLDVHYKVQGCQLLRSLLCTTPSSLLKRTGLTGVFEEAIFPILSYLPTLTPVDESVKLLDAALPCLIQLARTRYPATSRPEDPEPWDAKVKMTTKYIRHGILHGMMMAGEYPPIATCLVTHLATLIHEEGIDSVRHLKEVVPLLSGLLSDPFALAHPPLVIAAVHALQAVILNGWPRMEGWKGQVLKGACLLWIKITEEGKDAGTFGNLKTEVQQMVQMLDAAVKKAGNEGLAADVVTLIAADETVDGLFDGI